MLPRAVPGPAGDVEGDRLYVGRLRDDATTSVACQINRPNAGKPAGARIGSLRADVDWRPIRHLFKRAGIGLGSVRAADGWL